MNADDGKRYAYVSLSSLPTSSHPNSIPVCQLGRGLPCRLGFYDPFSNLPRFWNPQPGNSTAWERTGKVTAGMPS